MLSHQYSNGNSNGRSKGYVPPGGAGRMRMNACGIPVIFFAIPISF